MWRENHSKCIFYKKIMKKHFYPKTRVELDVYEYIQIDNILQLEKKETNLVYIFINILK